MASEFELLFSVASNGLFCKRYASLISRLIRFRSTAFLKYRLLTEKPACNFSDPSTCMKIDFKGKWLNCFPRLKIC